MKKIVTNLILCLSLVACSSSQNKNTNDEKEQLLKLGTSADYPPFEFLDDKNKIVGFDIDLLNAISAKTGIKFEVQNIQFDGLIPALVSGKIDAAMSSMSATEQRAKVVDFSEPYFKTEHLYVSKIDSTFTSKDELAGKKIGVQVGTLQESAARQIQDVIVVPFDSTPTLFASLKVGKIDALMTDSSLGYEFISRSPNEIKAFYSEADGSEGLAIAFAKDKFKTQIEQINKAINEMKNSGELQSIAKKYNLR